MNRQQRLHFHLIPSHSIKEHLIASMQKQMKQTLIGIGEQASRLLSVGLLNTEHRLGRYLIFCI